MHHTGGCRKWKESLLTLLLKTLIINGFVAWSLMKCEHDLEKVESFVPSQSIRNNKCKLWSLTYLTLEIAKELLLYVHRLEGKDEGMKQTPDTEQARCNCRPAA